MRRTPERDVIATPTYITYNLPLVAIITQKENDYESLEILTFPFDKITWILLIVCSILLMVINYFKQKLNISISCWHIVEALLGVPSYKIPKGFSIRTILILWILSTFLLRSVYQSLLFYLYRTQFYRNPPQTLYDLEQSGYKAICTTRTYPILQHIPQFSNETIPLQVLNTTDEMEPLRFLAKYPEKNFAGISVTDFVYYYVHKNKGPVYLVINGINNQQIGFYVPKHSYFIEPFNDCILTFHQMGFLQLWRQRIIQSYHIARGSYTTKYESELLINMKQFMGFIWVLLIIHGVALVVFGLELLSKKLKILQKLF